MSSCFRDATNNYDYHTTKVIKLVTGRNGGIYYRKTNRQVWDKQKTQRAIDAVNKEVGWLKASTTLVLPKVRCGKNKQFLKTQKGLGRLKTTFEFELVLEIVDHINSLESKTVRPHM